jgi:hypothetical protein
MSRVSEPAPVPTEQIAGYAEEYSYVPPSRHEVDDRCSLSLIEPGSLSARKIIRAA